MFRNQNICATNIECLVIIKRMKKVVDLKEIVGAVARGGRASGRLQAAGIARQRGEIRWCTMHKYTRAQRTNPWRRT